MRVVKSFVDWMSYATSKRQTEQGEVETPQRLSEERQTQKLIGRSKMRWSIVGMNRHPFVHTLAVAPTAPSFTERVRALRHARLHSAANRDLACAIEVAVKVVRDRPAERCGIIYLTAGRVCSGVSKLSTALDFAVSSDVSVHGIYMGRAPEIAGDLDWICTRSSLGYGSFYTASSETDLDHVLRRCMKGLIAPPWLKRFNRTVFIVDLTDEMSDPFGPTSRLCACAGALEMLVGDCYPPNRTTVRHVESPAEWHPTSARAA